MFTQNLKPNNRLFLLPQYTKHCRVLFIGAKPVSQSPLGINSFILLSNTPLSKRILLWHLRDLRPMSAPTVSADDYRLSFSPGLSTCSAETKKASRLIRKVRRTMRQYINWHTEPAKPPFHRLITQHFSVLFNPPIKPQAILKLH
jgi:hypothetical protein